LGSELNDPFLYQPLFNGDLFNNCKIKELIDIWVKFGEIVKEAGQQNTSSKKNYS
jgi:hypothetical protein